MAEQKVADRPALPVNRYLQRTAAKEGPCFICSLFTSNLLLTEQNTPVADWFYVCQTHIAQSAFCTVIRTEGTEDDKSKEEQNEEGKDEPMETVPSAKPVYVLHKDTFYLRQRPFIQRWEKKKFEHLSQYFPSLPQRQQMEKR